MSKILVSTLTFIIAVAMIGCAPQRRTPNTGKPPAAAAPSPTPGAGTAAEQRTGEGNGQQGPAAQQTPPTDARPGVTPPPADDTSGRKAADEREEDKKDKDKDDDKDKEKPIVVVRTSPTPEPSKAPVASPTPEAPVTPDVVTTYPQGADVEPSTEPSASPVVKSNQKTAGAPEAKPAAQAEAVKNELSLKLVEQTQYAEKYLISVPHEGKSRNFLVGLQANPQVGQIVMGQRLLVTGKESTTEYLKPATVECEAKEVKEKGLVACQVINTVLNISDKSEENLRLIIVRRAVSKTTLTLTSGDAALGEGLARLDRVSLTQLNGHSLISIDYLNINGVKNLAPADNALKKPIEFLSGELDDGTLIKGLISSLPKSIDEIGKDLTYEIVSLEKINAEDALLRLSAKSGTNKNTLDIKIENLSLPIK